jgi:hypothetical protein
MTYNDDHTAFNLPSRPEFTVGEAKSALKGTEQGSLRAGDASSGTLRSECPTFTA